MARNLLFITTDQQRWDSLPCYGLDFMQTPALDRLAAEGMVFENCSVSSPVCVLAEPPFSVQYASTTGVLDNGGWLHPSVPRGHRDWGRRGDAPLASARCTSVLGTIWAGLTSALSPKTSATCTCPTTTSTSSKPTEWSGPIR